MKDSFRVVFKFAVGQNGRYDFTGDPINQNIAFHPWMFSVIREMSTKATTASLAMIPIIHK